MVYIAIGQPKLCSKTLPQKEEGRVGREGEGTGEEGKEGRMGE